MKPWAKKLEAMSFDQTLMLTEDEATEMIKDLGVSSIMLSTDQKVYGITPDEITELKEIFDYSTPTVH